MESGDDSSADPESEESTVWGSAEPVGGFGSHLDELTSGCVGATGVDGAAVAILTDEAHARDLLYATDDVAARIDELQFTLGEGPCIQAFTGGHAHLVADIAERSASGDWPVFASEVLGELDVHAIFAFPMSIGGTKLGALELYRREPGPLTTFHLTTARAAAVTLAMTVVAELVSRSAQFTAFPDLQRRPQPRLLRADVNIAVGMLAVRLRLPPPDAFIRLRARAYADARSVCSLAYDIVHHGATIDDTDSAR